MFPSNLKTLSRDTLLLPATAGARTALWLACFAITIVLRTLNLPIGLGEANSSSSNRKLQSRDYLGQTMQPSPTFSASYAIS